ncbi:zona pellucida-like domain protein [Dictyocaulus viviparus]|uniref:Zona pellucida-like domain protein n=1 Tax=Dictyocaulus viviparus TaxID=29172 RepID=A0A0D8XME1_DICVI|nr:zona pellucida-like domain protein [Dictyocaulus viviparus]
MFESASDVTVCFHARYTGRRGTSVNLNPLTNGEYFEKYCLKAPFLCLDETFEQVPGRTMNSTPQKEISTSSVNSCLTECLADRSQCASTAFDYKTDLCLLFNESLFSHPELFVVAEDTDYFNVICKHSIEYDMQAEDVTAFHDVEGVLHSEDSDTENNVNDHLSPLNHAEMSRVYGFLTASSESQNRSNIVHQTESEVEGLVIDDTDKIAITRDHLRKTELTAECRMSGVTIRVEFVTPTSGSLYVKDTFAKCRSEFRNSTSAVLHIPFPRSDDPNPRCPGMEIAPSIWSFAISVQANEMDKPWLVTSTDRLFNVTCNFEDLILRKAANFPSNGGDSDEMQSTHIKMQILQRGQAVTTVQLGDEVTLKWTILDKVPGLDYFVDDCVAERVGGAAPQPEPLKIIQHGCPDENVNNRLINSPVIRDVDSFSTTMKVFRFDGSRRVRIRCTIDICMEYCSEAEYVETGNSSN